MTRSIIDSDHSPDVNDVVARNHVHNRPAPTHGCADALRWRPTADATQGVRRKQRVVVNVNPAADHPVAVLEEHA